MRKYFNLTTVAAGIAIGMIIAGALALVGGSYARDVVHDQLVPQQIFFPDKGEELPANLNQYAGQQVDTAKEAEAYANDYIGLHLEGIADGKSYAEVSAASRANPDDQEPPPSAKACSWAKPSAAPCSAPGAGGPSAPSPPSPASCSSASV